MQVVTSALRRNHGERGNGLADAKIIDARRNGAALKCSVGGPFAFSQFAKKPWRRFCQNGFTSAIIVCSGRLAYTARMKKQRLDTLLVEQGYFADAGAALRAVLAHEVKVGDVYACLLYTSRCV